MGGLNVAITTSRGDEDRGVPSRGAEQPTSRPENT